MSVPPQYAIRGFAPEDAGAWIGLMDSVFESPDNASALERLLAGALADGVFLAFAPGGECVGTASAVANAQGGHSSFAGGGEVGEVAVAPEHRRRGVGRAVCSAAIGRLVDAGHRTIWTGTRDERLAAVALFLDLGFVPPFYRCTRHTHVGPGMAIRWRRVRDHLGRS